MAQRTMTQGTPIVWKATGGDYAITLASLADTKARQGVKGDLNKNSQLAKNFSVQLRLETGTVAPTNGEVAYLFWSSSTSATAATTNDGGASGADEAYKDGAEIIYSRQLILIGALAIYGASNTVQQSTFIFQPLTRYGMPVVLNELGQALETNDDEHMISFIPMIDNIA